MGIPIGAIVPYIGTSAPNGWLLVAKNATVGNAASGANHASDQYEVLFDLLKVQSQNSGSEVFASGHTVKLPPLNGRVIACIDNAGGTPADVVTDAAADANGGVAGIEVHQLTGSQLAAHTHQTKGADGNFDDGDANNPYNVDVYPGMATSDRYWEEGSATIAASGHTTSAGSDNAHPNVQPTLFLNWIIAATSAASLVALMSGLRLSGLGLGL